MKENYSFFNSKEHDRVYNAKDWADYFFPLFRTGVFNGHLQVVENEGMSVKVNPGYAWIDGYKYHLWNEGTWDLEIASGNMNRMDSIVVRLDHTNKWVRIFCRTGSYYAGTPVPPAPEISSTIHEIVIAHVLVKAGTTRITQSMIKDTRMDKTICGWVCGAVEQIDFSQITAQFDSFFSDYRENILNAFNEYVTWQDDKKAEIEVWQAEEEKQTDDWQKKETDDFNAWVQDFIDKWESWLLGETKGWQEEIIDWFNNLREQLTENAAVQLQLQIGNLNNLETEEKEDLVSAVNSLALTYDETMAILAGVKTVTLTLSANDGASVEGQTVTLHNVATGKDKVMEYSGDGLTFNVAGDTKYILTVGSMELYKTPEPIEFIILLGEEMPKLNLEYTRKTLNELTWTEVARLSESGRADKLFDIHDAKEIELTTGEKVVVEIVGFNHDILASDVTKTAGITFGMKNCLTQTYSMNDTKTNVGSWKESKMRTVHIRDHFYDVLPDELKEVIKQVSKKTSAGNMSTTIETTEDDVWLFSRVELGFIPGSTDSFAPAYNQEGNMYPAFTSNETRKKGYGNDEALSRTKYFARSPIIGGNILFHFVTEGGDMDLYEEGAYAPEYRIAAGFCV